MFNNLPPIFKRLMNDSLKIDENVQNQFTFNSLHYNIDVMLAQTQLSVSKEVDLANIENAVYKY